MSADSQNLADLLTVSAQDLLGPWVSITCWQNGCGGEELYKLQIADHMCISRTELERVYRDAKGFVTLLTSRYRDLLLRRHDHISHEFAAELTALLAGRDKAAEPVVRKVEDLTADETASLASYA